MRILLLAVALAIVLITANGAEYNLGNSVVVLNNFSLDAAGASEISGSTGALEGESANITGIDGSVAVYNVPEGFNATGMALELLNYEEPAEIAGAPGFWSWTNLSTETSFMQAFAFAGDELLQVKMESDPSTIAAFLADLKLQSAEAEEINETAPEAPSNDTAPEASSNLTELNETQTSATELNVTLPVTAEENITESNATISQEINATIEKKPEQPASEPTAAVTIGRQVWDKPESDFPSENAAKRAEATHDSIRALKESLYNKGMGKVCTGGDC
jgi:hypothetical protein